MEPLLKLPYYLAPGWLKIDPTFAPLRGNARFDVAGIREITAAPLDQVALGSSPEGATRKRCTSSELRGLLGELGGGT